jgi:hypothetical protein
MAWNDSFVYRTTKITSAQLNAIIAKIQAIVETDLSLSDNTTNDVDTTKHGFMPKLPGGTGFYRADGLWAVTGAGDITGSTGSVDEGILMADGVAGATFQASAATITPDGSINLPAGETFSIDGVPLGGGAGTVTHTAGALTENALILGAGGDDIKTGTDLPTATTIGTKYAYRADGTDVPIADGGTGISTYPKRTIFLSAAGGWASTTTGAASQSTTETSSNKVNFRGISFAAGTTTAYQNWGMIMPNNYDGGTVLATPVFLPVTSDASNHTIIFGIAGLSLASTETRDTAFGTAVESTYTVAADQSAKIIFGPETSALTIGGASPAGGEFVTFRTYRKGASDTYTGAAILLGWKITYQTNGTSDV